MKVEGVPAAAAAEAEPTADERDAPEPEVKSAHRRRLQLFIATLLLSWLWRCCSFGLCSDYWGISLLVTFGGVYVGSS